MARFYCPAPIRLHQELILPSTSARHVQVRRLQPGDQITLFDGKNNAWRASILKMGRAEVSVMPNLHLPPEEITIRQVTLAIGMPANDRMDWLVEKATELGVHRIVPLMTERTILRLEGSRIEKRRTHWEGIAISACEQSGRNQLPQICLPINFNDWLKNSLDEENQIKVVLSTENAPNWRSLIITPEQSICLAIGPEGGLSPFELGQLKNIGFLPASLGAQILRSETAALVAAAHWAS
jgi:16S rRNA (uracil1498-N3)-methyltransferase